MSQAQNSDTTILKILSGTQSGAEVSLVAGEYSLGTAAADDIQFIDVSIKPAHARLRVSPGKIELAGSAGALRTATGLQLGPNGDWQDIEPLDVVTIGTTRLALGHPTSQWATVAEDDGSVPAAPSRPQPTGWRAWAETPQLRTFVAPLLALVLLVGFAAWFVIGGGAAHFGSRIDSSRDDLALAREALDQFAFGRSVAAHQEVDGTVYVNGYVDTPVERRALTAAVEKTGVPARIRLWVLQNIRGEVESLIAAQKLPLTFKLTPNGDLTLEGLILSDDRAARFVELIKDRVIGLGQVTSQIRTASSLLTEIERLATVAQIQPYVLLRVSNDLVEATGAIPTGKIDAYVGFLQSYARRFARDIPLRSLVQIQGAREAGLDRPIMIGGPAGTNEISIDLDRLAQGGYRTSDLVPGATRDGSSDPVRTAATSAPDQSAHAQAEGAGSLDTASAAATALARAAAKARRDAAVREASTVREPSTDPLGAAAPSPANRELSDQARATVGRWREGKLDGDARSASLRNALERLRAADPAATGAGAVPSWYLPVLSDTAEIADPCWTGSRLRPRDALSSLFWLDLISVDEGLTLAGFGRDVQQLLLETALSPDRTAACLRRTDETAAAAAKSIYLREIGRNPAFVRFVSRGLAPFTLDITGANLTAPRFIVLRGGRKMFEGSAPDQASRVAAIGELGVAIQLKTAAGTVIFEPDLTWIISQ